MEYFSLNLNPIGKRSGDCVVRAICGATNKTWEEVYNDLCKLGLEMKEMPNMKKVFEKYLEQIGWKKQKMPRFGDNTRYTLEEFADENNKGVYIINLANHLTYIEDGTLIDIWDCSGKSVGNYWKQ